MSLASKNLIITNSKVNDIITFLFNIKLINEYIINREYTKR